MSEEVRRLFRIAKGRSAEQTNSSTPTTTTGNSSSGNSTAGQLSGSSSSHSNVGATGSSSKRNIFQQCINYRRASTSSASPTLPNHHDEHSGHDHAYEDRGAPFTRQQSCTTECRKVNMKSSMESSSSSSSSSTAKPKLPPRPATVASSAPRTSSSSAICTVQQHLQQRNLHQQHSPAISTSSSSVESSPLPPTVMSQYPFQHKPQDQQQRRPGPPAELIMRPNSVPPPTLSSDRCANRGALEGPDEGVSQRGRDDGLSSTQSESLVSISFCRHHTVGRCQCHLLVSLCPHQQSKCIILVSLTYHLLL